MSDWLGKLFNGLLAVGKQAVEEEMKNLGVDINAPTNGGSQSTGNAEPLSDDNLDVIETTGETIDEQPIEEPQSKKR